jgi:hypothetical protein
VSPTVPPETLPREAAPLAAAVQPLEEESVHRMFKARERATVIGHSKVVEVAAHLGLNIEKLSPGASEEDFAVKGYFRRSYTISLKLYLTWSEIELF